MFTSLRYRGYTLTPLDQVCYSDVDTLQIPGGPSNVNNMRRTLRRMLSMAVEKQYLKAAPRIRLRRERQRKAVFSPEMEQEMLSLAEQPLRDIAMIVFDAGMRPDEIVRLQWTHVLWDKSLIYVDWGKTRKATRHVPLSDRVKAALRVRLQGSMSQWVFPSRRRKGSHISYFGPAKQFSALRDLVGIPRDLVLYSARHTFGTDLLERTGNIKLVQEAMGHESVTTTQRYLHPDKSEMAGHINDRNRDRARRAEIAGHTSGHTDKTVN